VVFVGYVRGDLGRDIGLVLRRDRVVSGPGCAFWAGGQKFPFVQLSGAIRYGGHLDGGALGAGALDLLGPDRRSDREAYAELLPSGAAGFAHAVESPTAAHVDFGKKHSYIQTHEREHSQDGRAMTRIVDLI
jgi:hypothetical protein